jgi:signal transduction histidine kinase
MKLPITSRMRAGFAAMSVLLLAGGLVTVLYTYHVQTVTANLLARSVTSFKAAEAVEVALERMQASTADDILASDPQARMVLDGRRDDFRGLMHQVEGTARGPRQADLLRQLWKSFAEYERTLNSALELARSGQAVPARALVGRASAISGDMDTLWEAFEGVTEGLMYADLARLERSNHAMRVAMYGLGASGILLGYFLGLVISRSITKPIYQLVLKVRDATGHELVERVDVPRGAELEALDGHVRQLIEGINTTRADLEKSRRLLERSEKLAALGRVSAGIAHEIRNPLTSIKMLVHSMGEDAALGTDQRQDLAVIVKEINRMDRFIDNFLKFARPPDPKLVPVDPNEIVHETLELLALRLRQANARLVENYQADLGTIAADPNQIRRVIVNLVLNALDAMPDGGSLTLETRRLPPANGEATGWVQLHVRDTGHGIPEELLNTLFDPFVSGREDGVGLGLSISYQIVQQHGGWIDAANDPAGGTTVTVTLPDHQGQEHAQGSGGGRRGERPLLVPEDAA